MTIEEIILKTKKTEPYFFSKSTLRTFNQKIKDFQVERQPDGRFKIWARSKDNDGKKRGLTIRFFNPSNNLLEYR